MARPPILEGTWEELKLHDRELTGKRFRLVPLPPEPSKAVTLRESPRQEDRKTSRKLTGMGKFAGIIPTSKEFMRLKQEDIELEERKLRR